MATTTADDSKQMSRQARLKRMCSLLDLDGNGVLQLNEISLLQQEDDQEVSQQLVHVLDRDGDGTVTLQEYIAFMNDYINRSTKRLPGSAKSWMENHIIWCTIGTVSANLSMKNENLNEEQFIEKMVRSLDADNSGALEVSELRTIVEQMIPNQKEQTEEVARLVALGDSNGDGNLATDEAVAMFSHLFKRGGKQSKLVYFVAGMLREAALWGVEVPQLLQMIRSYQS